MWPSTRPPKSILSPLTACSTSWALLALSPKLFPRLAPWLPFLNAGFMGRGCWLISLLPLWGCGQLFSWPLPKHLSERAGMQMLCSRPIASLKSSRSCQKQRHQMWDISKHKPFHKHVHFFVRDTFLLPTPKSEGWVKASSHYHSGDIASKERLTLKNVRWTAASESETDHPKSRKQLCSGHCKIIFFWANYMLAVKMTQLWLLSPFFFFFFNKELSLRIKRHLHRFCPTCYIKEHLHHHQISLLCWYCTQIQTWRYRAFYFSPWTLKSCGLFLISCSLKKAI